MDIQKKYYTIEEISKLVDRPASTIRFWESKLPHLRPKVHGSNNRRKYQIDEISLVRQVSDLVDLGISIKGIVRAYEKGYLDRLHEVLSQFKEL